MNPSAHLQTVQPDATLERIVSLARRALRLPWLWLCGPGGEVLAGARPLELRQAGPQLGGPQLGMPQLGGPELDRIYALEHSDWGTLGELGLSKAPPPHLEALEAELEAELEADILELRALLTDVLAQQQAGLWSTGTFEHSPQPCFATDLEGKVRHFNPAALTLFRLSAEEVQGQLFERIPALSSPRLDVAFSQICSGAEVRPLELPCFRSDGTVALLRFSLAPLLDAGSRLRGVVFCADDLLASLEDSGERESLRRLYAEVLDHLPLELTLLDAQERVIYLNPHLVPDARVRRSFQGMFRESVYRALGRTETQLEGWRKRYAKVRRTLGRVQWEETVSGPQGPRYLLRSIQPILSSGRKIEMFVSFTLDLSEQKQAQLEREEALLLFQGLFEHATEGIYRVDAIGQLLWANPALVRFNGCSSEEELREALGKNPGSWYVQPERFAEFMRLLETDSGVVGFESEVQLKLSGERRWITESARAVRNDSGQRLYIEGTIQDITARKLAEAQLEREKRLLEQVFDTSPNPIFVRDTAGQLVLVNARLLQVNNTNAADFWAGVGSRHPDNAAEFAQWLENDRIMLAQGEAMTFEEKFTRTDGQVIVYSTVKAPLLREDGSVQVLGISTDITEMRRNTERLSFIERAVEASSDSISISNAHGEVIYLNSAAKRHFGYTLEHLRQHTENGTELIPPQIIPQVQRAFVQNEPFQGETTVLGALGTEIPVLMRLDQMRGAQGEEIGVVAVVTDITERKRMEQLKDDFVATVSHELRTPLTSISGALGLLVAGVLGDISEEQRPMLDIAHQNAERLIVLVGDLLDMQKMEGEGLSLSLKPLELRAVLEQAAAEMAPYARNLGVSLVLELGKKSQNVRGDFGRLAQVATNLLSNACKFSSAEGSVSVRMLERSGWVRVEVEDRGSGIPEGFRGQIFSKFAQADASSTRVRGGTGLGLAISRAIVQRHGGVIGFEPLEVGTLFYFELPLLEG